ncbi:MAG: RNA polymerase subunit sigma-24 [Anaeromyxobacter sp. RBG_16_69_14]|nr:MAG: RNA polymerase subunit sigma-24 [Anaeromyxobacter sp. RBG_16_69_14]
MSVESHVRGLLESGDLPGAATEAIRGLGPDILRYLRSILRNEEDAADAFSQFAENLWKGLASFRGQATLRTWAFRIAWNVALNLRNEPWNRRGRRLLTGEASGLAEELRTKTVVRVARQQQALDKLRQSLSPEDQSLLALRLDQQFSWEEIAEVFSRSGKPIRAATLTKRFERLKDRLAQMAREQGLVD